MGKLFQIIITLLFAQFLTSCDKEYYDITIINSFNNNDSAKTQNDSVANKTSGNATVSFGVEDVEFGN
jgi:hypothetical protein